VLLLGAAGIGHTQSVDMSELEACAGLATAELKLACFEAIVNTGKGMLAAEADAPQRAPPLTETQASPAVPVETEALAAKDTAVTAAERPQRRTDDFGSEQLGRSKDAGEAVLHATVTAITRGANRALIFHLSNGQIWRQIEPRHFPYPKQREFDVIISTGIMGEYRLQVGDAGRKVRIRRVQ